MITYRGWLSNSPLPHYHPKVSNGIVCRHLSLRVKQLLGGNVASSDARGAAQVTPLFLEQGSLCLESCHPRFPLVACEAPDWDGVSGLKACGDPTVNVSRRDADDLAIRHTNVVEGNEM